MASSTENRLVCEQCGAQLKAADAHCLRCLLTGGLEDETPGLTSDTATSSGPETLSGTRFYQHYEIETRPDGSLFELGRGAMGVTYKAVDVNLRLPVALKVINARFSAQPEARARFLREARAAARLRHPNVASVFHYGTIEGGSEREHAEECFYAMEFVDGETLEARVRRAGPLPLELGLRMALQVARALAAAEKRGLIHRDLKPSNIMLSAEGETSGDAWVKVIDFGLAKAIAEGDELAGDTFATRGGFHGTPKFASPEQMQTGELDTRSDIYSLGVTLWYALTGELPFEGETLAEVHDRQMHRPLPEAWLKDAGIPALVSALLGSMLSADPEKRPASAAQLCERLTSCLAGTQPGRSKHGLVLAAAVATVVLALVAGYFLARSARTSTAELDKSVAVLPLENLSDDKENAFFAEGIQDDLLTSLGKIKDLKVISRSSVLQYRAGSARNLPEIGRQLGVSHVLEGSVRRAADRVLVNVQLVETGTHRQVWSERYDRKLSDALTLQGELATEIASALQARLDPEEKTRVQTKPTSSADAYVLYLRGRSYELRPTYLLQDFQTAETLYTQAIALDPQFALAHARLSSTLAFIYRNAALTESVKARAHAEAEEALRLQPNLGEAHLARALCFYRIERDYEQALRELDIAARLLPNDSGVEATISFIRRRQGKWKEALAELNRAMAHDPRDAQIAQELFNTYRLLRDWPAAAQAADRAIAFAPDLPLLRLERGYVELWSKGDLGPLQKALAEMPAGFDPDGAVTWIRWDACMLARDFPAAERAAAAYANEILPSVGGGPLPKTFLQGCAALANGEQERAGVFFEAARPSMEKESRDNPQSALRQARLGILYAYLGRKEEAINAGRRATELQPESTDAYGGAFYTSMLALVYARTGQAEQALPLIERLLRIPGAVFYYEAAITLPELRLRWQWDPLRGDERFENILRSPEPATVY